MGMTTKKARAQWLREFQAIATNFGGRCLSDEYINQNTRLSFECADGHTWAALPMNVYHRGSWCPQGAGNARYTLDDVRLAARQSGAECLSQNYLGYHKPLKFRCSADHDFTTRVASVMKGGVFCAECQRLTLDEFQALCDEINYTLLSTEYVNNYTPLRVICDAGHPWNAQPKHLKEGKRCPDCKAGKLMNGKRRERRFSYH